MRLAILLCCSLALVGCLLPGGHQFGRLVRSKSQPVPPEATLAGRQVDSAKQPVVRLVGVVEPAELVELATNEPEVAESIVARVNGDAILARELFDPIQARLDDARQAVSPEEFIKLRDGALRQQLRNLIERHLLIQEARRVLPEQAIRRLEVMADQQFAEKIESEMTRMGVSTEAELRRKLSETGQSLDQLKQYRRGTSLARQFLSMQIGPRLTASRRDMLKYFEAHTDEFQRQAGVRWSEILISYDKHSSPEAALAQTEELLEQLRRGEDFAELARAQSDGATAYEGGKWDLTAKGSYIVAEVDKALFSLPVGQLSEPIQGPKGWHIVRVDERIEQGTASFVEKQQEILARLREQQFREESKNYMQQLIQKAHITTIFDQPESKP